MIYAGLVTFVLLSAAFPVVVAFFIDLRLHEGVSWFTRRSVLRTGRAATAKVLSSSVLLRQTGRRYASAHSIVYEVLPEGEAPFRAKGIEVLTLSESVREGASVEVRFDAARKIVVLVRPDPAQVLAAREAARLEREKQLLGRD